jgi:endonuclease/exonuclease/phosphatase (EEP) superfamily protein YafD
MSRMLHADSQSSSLIPPSLAPPAIKIAGRQRMAAPAVWISIGLLAPLALAHYVAGRGVLFDLAANVSYFVAGPLLLIAITAAMVRQPIAAACSVILATVAATPLLLRIDWPEHAGPPGSDVSVLFCNLEGNPAAWDRLRLIIDQRRPDLVALVEAGRDVVERVTSDNALREAYPHRITPQPGLQWTQVVLSRHPFEMPKWEGDFKRYKFLYSFRRTALVDLPQGRLLFTVEHPPSPRGERAWNSGNNVIRLLGELVRNQFAATALPFVVAGDFNTSPTGYRDSLLRRATGLQADPLGGFPRGTWPSFFPAYWRLPLDRVWASQGIAFTRREVLEDVHSDHRPILVRFRLTGLASPQ